jgi:DNA-binding NarL/FixJ family response regulator
MIFGSVERVEEVPPELLDFLAQQCSMMLYAFLHPALARSSKSLEAIEQVIPPVQQFTPKEHDVLALMVQGYKASKIAEYLGIVYSTVKSHQNKIYQKLHVSNQEDARAVAICQGYVNPFEPVTLSG